MIGGWLVGVYLVIGYVLMPLVWVGRVGISALWLYVFYLVSCLLEVSVGRCGFNSVVMHGSLCLCTCWCC